MIAFRLDLDQVRSQGTRAAKIAVRKANAYQRRLMIVDPSEHKMLTQDSASPGRICPAVWFTNATPEPVGESDIIPRKSRVASESTFTLAMASFRTTVSDLKCGFVRRKPGKIFDVRLKITSIAADSNATPATFAGTGAISLPRLSPCNLDIRKAEESLGEGLWNRPPQALHW